MKNSRSVRDELIARAMRRALRLALKGEGETSPNPLVGAVLLKGGRIVGEGYHSKIGCAHAEVEALIDARRRGINPRGATMVVNLEPCCHYGCTPPCTDALIAAKIAAVYVAHQDPNPKVNGQGFRILRKAGIKVNVGLMGTEAWKLNQVYCKWIHTQRPFVVLKGAASLDGKIALASGQSQWISGPAARLFANQLRRKYDAVLVGVNTVIADDPQLTCRIQSRRPYRQPLRIVMDSNLRIPTTAKVVSGALPGETLIATTQPADSEKALLLTRPGVVVETFPATAEGRVDLVSMTAALGSRGISSILVEGGGQILGACLNSGIADKLSLVLAPKIIGGQNSISLFGCQLAATIEQARPLFGMTVKNLAGDWLVEGYFREEICSPV